MIKIIIITVKIMITATGENKCVSLQGHRIAGENISL
jgi:hypothetical protein